MNNEIIAFRQFISKDDDTYVCVRTEITPSESDVYTTVDLTLGNAGNSVCLYYNMGSNSDEASTEAEYKEALDTLMTVKAAVNVAMDELDSHYHAIMDAYADKEEASAALQE